MPAPKYSIGQKTKQGVIEVVYDLGESVENQYQIGGVHYSEGDVEVVESEEDASADQAGSGPVEPAETGGDSGGPESGVVGSPVGSAELLQPAESEPAASDGRKRRGGAAAE